MTADTLDIAAAKPRRPVFGRLGNHLKFAWTSGLRELRKRFEDSLLG